MSVGDVEKNIMLIFLVYLLLALIQFLFSSSAPCISAHLLCVCLHYTPRKHL